MEIRKNKDTKDVHLSLRIGKDDLRKLKTVAFWSKKSTSEVIRDTIELAYKVEKMKHPD